MLFELLCIAGAGLIGYKAFTDPEGTKDAVKTIGKATAQGVKYTMKSDEMRYRHGELSDDAYQNRKDTGTRFLSKYNELTGTDCQNVNGYDDI